MLVTFQTNHVWCSHERNTLDPRHVLPDSILGSIANLYEVSFVGFPFTFDDIGTKFFERELGLSMFRGITSSN